MDDRTARADAIPRRVVSRVHGYPEGNNQGSHAHRKAQLAGADRDSFTVTTPIGAWCVPASWAVWVPSHVEYEMTSDESLRLFSIYLEPEDTADLPQHPCVMSVPPLLGALIDASCELPALYDEAGAEGRVIATLVDQIHGLAAAPMNVAVPVSDPLRLLYDHYRTAPSSRRTLTEWAEACGTTWRTLTRLFAQELGVDFRTWRTQLRLLHGLSLLRRGLSATEVSVGLGYESMGSFVQVFRKYLGTTPGRYVRSSS